MTHIKAQTSELNSTSDIANSKIHSNLVVSHHVILSAIILINLEFSPSCANLYMLDFQTSQLHRAHIKGTTPFVVGLNFAVFQPIASLREQVKLIQDKKPYSGWEITCHLPPAKQLGEIKYNPEGQNFTSQICSKT
jgi:hypothetical protein